MVVTACHENLYGSIISVHEFLSEGNFPRRQRTMIGNHTATIYMTVFSGGERPLRYS